MKAMMARLLPGLALCVIVALGSPVLAARRSIPRDPHSLEKQAAQAAVSNAKSLLKDQGANRVRAKATDPEAPPPPRHYFPQPPKVPQPQL